VSDLWRRHKTGSRFELHTIRPAPAQNHEQLVQPRVVFVVCQRSPSDNRNIGIADLEGMTSRRSPIHRYLDRPDAKGHARRHRNIPASTEALIRCVVVNRGRRGGAAVDAAPLRDELVRTRHVFPLEKGR